jgi:hypothetical protein
MAKATAPSEATGSALARTGPTALEAPPDFIKADDAHRGFEAMEGTDVTIPRLALCQSSTPARKKGNELYIEGLQEGDLFNSLTKQIYGDSVIVTPLFFFKTRIMFKPLDQGGGIICQAADGRSCQLNHGGACLHGGFGPGGEKPECNEFFNYAALLHQADGSIDQIVLSFKSTALKKAKDWNSEMRQTKRPMYACRWMISTAAAHKDKFDYFTVNFTQQGWETNREVFEYAEATYESLREGIIRGTTRVDQTGMGAEGGPAEM